MSSLVARDLRQRAIIRHRWSLVEGVDLPLGRSVKSSQLQAAWDDRIADWHAMVRWEAGRLVVSRNGPPSPGNEIFYNGLDLDQFTIVPGEGFVIGTTIFQLDRPQEERSESGQLSSSRTQFFRVDQLRTQLNSENENLQLVSGLLRQFQERQQTADFFERLVVQTLRRVVRRADFAAILHQRGDAVRVRLGDGELGVCPQLVLDAIQKQRLVAHRWGAKAETTYPKVPGATWAVCAPVVSNVEFDGNFAVYLSGARGAAGGVSEFSALPDDQLSFIAIVADMLQLGDMLRNLKACRKSIEEFLPQPIRAELASHEAADVLRTEEVDAAILFCDLRGSSKFAAQHADDLMTAWNRVREALSVMTEAITNQYGSIGDFQGDAAMGFWGWPRISSTTDDAVLSACKAADKLRERFHQRSRDEGPLSGFACGIGIAAGRVVAGMLGTADQRKIGVFGPAVNLAARLESMTKQLGASILMDDQACLSLRDADRRLSSRIRYLATLQPVGIDSSVRVHELMPPADNPQALTPQQLKLFEFGRSSFEKGRWQDARPSLQKLAQAGDGPSEFLVHVIERMETPPGDWNGCIVLTAK